MSHFEERLKAEFQGLHLPAYMMGGVVEYVMRGRAPGHFLAALFSNDLKGCFERADESNALVLKQYVHLLYNYAPAGCWGSKEKFQDWLKAGGLEGLAQKEAEKNG